MSTIKKDTNTQSKESIRLGFWNELPKSFSILAPMEDVTDQAFRRILLTHGRPDVFFSEFTSVSGLSSEEGRSKVIHRLRYNEDEHPIVAQIWGVEPEEYYEGTKIAQALGFDGVDINMGCPVKKIIKQGACSALIKNPTLAGEIIAAVKEAANEIPVSVKTRMGFDTKVTEDWMTFLLSKGLAAITLHPRLAVEMSTKDADWKEVRKAVEIRDELRIETLIIGNGDIKSIDEGERNCDVYGCDGFMVGRGIFDDPWLFSKDSRQRSVEERINMLIEHLDLYLHLWENTKNFNKMKKFYKMYIKGFEGAVELRERLMAQEDIPSTIKILKEFAHE